MKPRYLSAAAGAAALLLAHGAIGATEPQRQPVATTPQFAFYSDLATNLNDALIVAGSARNDAAPELFRAGPEVACFERLAPSERAGWNRAVDYYAEIISPVDWGDRQQFLLRLDLAGIEDAPADAAARRFVAIAAGFMAAARSAYEACRWAEQDAENRRWIEALGPQLAAYEATIARRLERLYQTPWHGLPIQVDVVSTAPSKGANSIIRSPAGGHILISSSIPVDDNVALEIVFHEASHTVAATWRADPLPAALARAAERLDVALPRDLWHVVLFYTTGETVRRVLAQAGEPDYTPYVYAHDLWRGPWARYRGPIERAWPAYLDGQRTLTEAAADLLKALAEPDPQR